MPDKKAVNILDAISEHKDFHTSIILTYGANLAFYEQVVLGRFWQANIRNNLIFMDAVRYSETTEDFRDIIGYVGRRYLAIPVNLGYLQSFHPKLIYLLGSDRARLLIGSGNLTFNGYGDNLEIFTQLDWSLKDKEFHYLFIETWHLICNIQKRWGHSNQANRMLQKAEALSTWLTNESPVGDIQFIHSLDVPLLDQLVEAIGKNRVNRFTILSPFLDNHAKSIQEIHQKFHPKHIGLVLQDGQTVGNPESLDQLLAAKLPISLYGLIKTKRYAHAKLYLVETTQDTYLATGSPNCTKAGLLSNSSNGNLEVMLLRKYKSSVTANRILQEYLDPEPITKLSAFEIKPHTPIAPKRKTFVQLLDITIEGENLTIKYNLLSLPKNVKRLGLYISFPKTTTLEIPDFKIGFNERKIELLEDKSRLIFIGPLSAFMCGLNEENQIIDLHSNSLWITNATELNQRQLFLTLKDENAGKRLNEMLIGSDAEWRELFDSINSLVELDIRRIQSVPRGRINVEKKITSNIGGDEPETRIQIVTEGLEHHPSDIEAEIYNESRLHSWLEIVFKQFPLESVKQSDHPTPVPEKRHRPHKPSPDLARQFISLVRRYIRSINNPEFTKNASIYYLLAYFSIFQRIIWLLRNHKVIDNEKYVLFLTQINNGFFGNPIDGLVPLGIPESYNHLNRRYDAQWRENLTHLYALAALITREDINISADTLESFNLQIAELYIHVLACIYPVLHPADIFTEADIALVAYSYGMNETKFFKRLTQIYKRYSLRALARLDEWTNKTILQMKDVDSDSGNNVFLHTLVSIGIGSERICKYLDMTEKRADYCTDLVFWASRIEDTELANQYQQQLITLIREKGDLPLLARALFDQGRKFTLNKDYDQAVKSLLQAHTIAEELTDKDLKRIIKIHLSTAQFLSRSYS